MEAYKFIKKESGDILLEKTIIDSSNYKIEKQQNGSLLITDIINSQLIKKVYYFTTLTQAKKDFKAYTNQLKQNWYEYLAK
jgi:hypothetical protein